MHALLFYQLFALSVGLCIGSFLNVCIARMPHDRSVVSPGSACPSCMKPIQAWDNIPVLSWLILRARCRTCKTPISALYPTVELLMGLLSLLLFRQMIPDLGHFTPYSLAMWAAYTIFLGMLIALSLIDIRWKIIPDQFSIYAIPFGIALAFALPQLRGQPIDVVPSGIDATIGAVAGVASLLSIMGIYWLVRREEGMGMGDVKLLGMMGAFLGWQALLPIVLIGSISGSIIGVSLMLTQGRGFRSQVPFGPFLSLGGIVYLFFWRDIQSTLFLA